MRPLNEEIKLIKVSDVAAADTTSINSSGVDLSQSGGWDGVMFLVSFGTGATGNLIFAEQSSDDGSADAYTALKGSALVPGSSDEDQWLDIFRPQEQWVRCVADRGTSSTIENMWAILYRGRSKPYSNITSGTIIGKAHVSPAEGSK